MILSTYSGDGTLSVVDVRSKKPEPVAHSEDQEDELLSIVSVKGLAIFIVPPFLFRKRPGINDVGMKCGYALNCRCESLCQ